MLVQTPANYAKGKSESEYPISHRREPAIPLSIGWHLATSAKLA